MKRLFFAIVSLALLVSCGGNKTDKTTVNNAVTISDQDIADAYIYLLGRELKI